jgi:hypothetical protein
MRERKMEGKGLPSPQVSLFSRGHGETQLMNREETPNLRLSRLRRTVEREVVCLIRVRDDGGWEDGRL